MQVQREEDEVDHGRGSKTILKSGQVWTVISVRPAEHRTRWKGIVAKWSAVPQRGLQGYWVEQNRIKVYGYTFVFSAILQTRETTFVISCLFFLTHFFQTI